MNAESDNDELKELYALREIIASRIARLEQRRILPISNNGAGSAINTEDIRPYVQGWIDEGHTLKSLADKADVSQNTLTHIMRLNRPTIKEKTADKILQALGLPHLYQAIVPERPADYHYEEL